MQLSEDRDPRRRTPEDAPDRLSEAMVYGLALLGLAAAVALLRYANVV